MRISFEPVPVSALISEQGLTSYGTYTRFAAGGQTTLVNMLSGNLVIDPVDVAISGRGVSLVLQRVYNMQDTTVGFFGLGWSSFLDARLERCAPKCFSATHKYLDPTGATYFFDFSIVDAGFASAERIEGLRASLIRSADAHIIVYDTGIQFKFLAATGGLLAAIEDRNGNRITIERDQSGFPTKIFDSLHREIMITPHASGMRIGKITPPGGLASVSYDYDGELLTIVTRADQTTEYEYNQCKGPTSKIHFCLNEIRSYAVVKSRVKLGHESTEMQG
jgi:hypothetical protein